MHAVMIFVVLAIGRTSDTLSPPICFPLLASTTIHALADTNGARSSWTTLINVSDFSAEACAEMGIGNAIATNAMATNNRHAMGCSNDWCGCDQRDLS